MRPKVRPAKLAAAPMRKRRQSLTAGESDKYAHKLAAEPDLGDHKTHASTFRWQRCREIVMDSLDGITFSITGTLERLSREDLVEMIEWCGGTVYKTLAKKSQYLIVGDRPSKAWIKKALDMGKNVIYEEEFFTMVKNLGRLRKFTKYRDEPNLSSDESDDDDSNSSLSSYFFDSSHTDTTDG